MLIEIYYKCTNLYTIKCMQSNCRLTQYDTLTLQNVELLPLRLLRISPSSEKGKNVHILISFSNHGSLDDGKQLLTLVQSFLGEDMALKFINKINGRLKFICRKNRYLTPYLTRLLCNALIHAHFGYAFPAWCLNINKRFKSKLQTIQNKLSPATTIRSLREKFNFCISEVFCLY